MLTKTISDKRKDNFKFTTCTNSVPNKKKKIQINKKKKRCSLSPTTQITYNSCGHKIIRKIVVPEEIKRQRKRSKKKIMTDKYSNCVQCPNFKINSLKPSNEGKETIKSKNQNTLSQQSICMRELKKIRDISRYGALNTKSTECSSCCKNSDNLHYAVNYKPSRNMNSYSNYFNKTNNLDSDFSYKTLDDQQQRYRTRYVHCPNSLKNNDKFLTNYEEKNSHNYAKNRDNFTTIERIVCSNKNLDDVYPCRGEESPEQDTNLNKSFCIRSRDDSVKYNKELSFNSNANDNKNCYSDDQRMVKLFPRLDTKFENGVFDAYSPFKISIQCYGRSQNKQRVNEAANQETQTALEIKQQAISTDATNYSSKETQCEGTMTQSRQTGIDDDDDMHNRNTPKTVCVSCDQTNEIKDDYFLLMPGGKCVKLAQEIFTDENFVPCPGANNNYDDESFSICTETSITTEESKQLVDSNTMTIPELAEGVEQMLRSDSEEAEIQEIFDSQTLSKTKNDKKSQCRACKNNQVVDEDLKFCFEKLFNLKLTNSNCFPCLKEKLDKTGNLKNKFLYILKYALELSSNAENSSNVLDSRFKSKNTNEIIKKLCKCVKKLSDAEILKQTKSKNHLQNKESKKVSTEEESAISQNLVQKSVGIEKQTETDKRPIISRSMNTFVEEIPIEIVQTLLESEGTNTDYLTLSKETGTNTVEKKRSQDASTQSRLTKNFHNKIKMTTNQCREPILVRVISSSDRPKAKIQSQSSEYLTSESDDFRRNGLRRVCFNDKTQFQMLKKDLRNCEENCVNPNQDYTKIRTSEKKHFKLKKKLLNKKCVDDQRVRNIENRKIFYSDFFD